jgi:hypothetical protein
MQVIFWSENISNHKILIEESLEEFYDDLFSIKNLYNVQRFCHNYEMDIKAKYKNICHYIENNDFSDIPSFKGMNLLLRFQAEFKFDTCFTFFHMFKEDSLKLVFISEKDIIEKSNEILKDLEDVKDSFSEEELKNVLREELSSHLGIILTKNKIDFVF